MRVLYDPDLLSVARLTAEARRAGAEIGERIGHETFELQELDCPDCAAGIEKAVDQLAMRDEPMGRIVVADIGIAAASALIEIARPRLTGPSADAHKYSRGLVTIIAGQMPGASILAAAGAARGGAGSVRLQAKEIVRGVPAAVVQNGAGPLDRCG